MEIDWFFNYYALVLFLCGLTSAGAGVYAWKQHAQVGPGLAFTLWGITIWSLSYGIAIGVHDLTGRILWAKILHIGVALTAISAIVSVVYFIGRTDWLSWRNLFLVSAIPLIGLILAWTNEWHRLIWSSTGLRIEGSLALLNVTYGPYFWVYAAYNGLVWLVCVGAFLRAALRSSYLERRQAASILIGVMLPGIALLVNVAGFRSLHGLDFLPLGISLAGLAITWGLFRYQLFKIVSVARDIVLDKIIDGVLVLDKDGRVVDINPAMLRMISRPVSRLIGQPVTQILDGQLELVQRYQNVPKAQTQLVMYTGDKLSTYDLYISTLYGRRNEFNGQVLLFHDITEQKKTEHAIKQAHEHLDATLNALPDMLFEVDRDGMIYDFRAPDPEMAYLPSHELLGKNLSQVFPEEVVRVINFTLAQATELGMYRGSIYSLPLNNGIGWFELSVAAKGDLKEPDGRFVVLVRDITERKLANDRLESQLVEIQLLQAELQERTLRDPLTGLYNRRYLQETLPREFARLERIGHPLGVIIMDIDHFKTVNDSYGHDAGDIILQMIGKLLQANIRTEDIACRHGGDEFVIVMPDAGFQACQDRAERIRLLIEAAVTKYESKTIRVTVSMGVAAYPMHGSNGEEILICADRALYKAKQEGRNRVETYLTNG